MSSRVRNRLVKATMTVAGGSPVTLVTNAYDEYNSYVPCGPSPITLSAPTSSITMHDDTNYGTAFTRRGNLTSSRAMQVSWSCKSYETTGNLLTSFGPSQPTVNVTPSAARNNAVPQAMSVGGLTTTFDWNGLLQLTGSTAPNNATTSIGYDGYARPAATTTPTGATATMTYTVNTTTAAVNGRSTVTTSMGSGGRRRWKPRTGGVLVSTVETEYESCACTPFGSWSVDGGDGVDALRV